MGMPREVPPERALPGEGPPARGRWDMPEEAPTEQIRAGTGKNLASA